MNLGQFIVDAMMVGAISIAILLFGSFALAALYEVWSWLKQGVFYSKARDEIEVLFWGIAGGIVLIVVITLVGALVMLLYRGVTFYL